MPDSFTPIDEVDHDDSFTPLSIPKSEVEDMVAKVQALRTPIHPFERELEFGSQQPQPTFGPSPAVASFLREAQAGTGEAIKGAAAVGETGPLWPAGLVGGMPPPEPIRRLEEYRKTRTPSQTLEDIRSNPFFVAGQALAETAPEAHPVAPEEEKFLETRLAGTAGGFFPLVATGAAAPLTIGLQSAGAHITADYDAARNEGLTEDEAAKRAMDRALASGTLQSTIFLALPKVLRGAAEKYLVDKFGQEGFSRWLTGRVSAGAEGATLGATSKALENVVEGRPLTEGTLQSAAGLGGINLLMPWLRPKPMTEAEVRAALAKPTDTGEFFGPPKGRTASDLDRLFALPDWVREGLSLKLFGKPLAELNTEQLKDVLAQAPKEPEWVKAAQAEREKSNAQRVRSDQGQPGTERGQPEERQGPGGEDLEQPTPGEPQPVEPGKEKEAPKEEVKPPTPAEDYARFQALKASLKGKTLDEAQAIMAEMEAIKNRNAGMPPKAPATIAAQGEVVHAAGEVPAILTADEFVEHVKSGKTVNNKHTRAAGLGAKSIEDLEKFAKLYEERKAAVEELDRQAKAETDPEKKMALLMQKANARLQLPREAIEEATASGSAYTVDPTTPRPLDFRKNPEIAKWLLDNADRIGLHKDTVADIKANAPKAKRGRPKKIKPPPSNIPEPSAPEPAAVETEVPEKPETPEFKKLRETLKKAGDDARERVVQLRPVLGLENIRDLAILSLDKLTEFGFDKSRWVSHMVQEFGNEIKPHLREIFKESLNAIRSLPPDQKTSAYEKIADRIERMHDQIQALDKGPRSKQATDLRRSISGKLNELVTEYPEADIIRRDRLDKKFAEDRLQLQEERSRELEVADFRKSSTADLRRRQKELTALLEGIGTGNIPPNLRGEWNREWQRQKDLITSVLETREKSEAGVAAFAEAVRTAKPGIKPTPETNPAEYPPQVAREYLQGEIRKLEQAGTLTPEQQERMKRLRDLDREIHKQNPSEAEIAAARVARSEQVVRSIEEAGRQAAERIKKRRGKGGTTFSMAGAGDIERFLENVADLSIIGAAKLARFGLDKAKFISEMRKTFGPWLNAHMDELYNASVQMLTRYGEKLRAKQTPIQEIITQHTGLDPSKKGDLAKTIEALENAFKTIRTLRDHFEGGDKMPTAEVKLADDFLEADANKIRESLTQYVQEKLPVSERGRFVRAIANATRRESILTGNPETMYVRAAKVAAAIEAWSEETAKKRLITRIGDMANAAMKSSGVDIGYKQRIKAIMDDLLLNRPTPATIRRLEAMRDFAERMEAQGIDPGIPKKVLDSLNLLAKTPAKDLPLDVLQGIHDQIQLNAELGRLKVRGRKEAWKAEKDLKTGQLETEQTHPWNKSAPVMNLGEEEGFMTKYANYMRKVQNTFGMIDRLMLPIDPLMDMLGAAKGLYDGWLFRNLRNPIDLAFNRGLGLRDEMQNPIRALIRQYQFSKKDGQIIGVYAHNLQQGGRERMIRMLIPADMEIPESLKEAGPEYLKARAEASRKIDAVLKKMTPQHLEVYRAMRGQLDKRLPQLQQIMHQLYNIEVRPVEHYFPMPREWAEYRIREPGTEMKEPKEGQPIQQGDLGGWRELMADFGPAPGGKTEQGFTIARLPNAESAIKMNAFDIYDRHSQDVSHLIETQRDLKMAWELTQTPEFKRKYGRDGMMALQGWLDVVARQGHMSGLRRLPMLDWFRRNTSVGVIGFRIVSNLVHSSNIPFGIQRAGLTHWSRAAGEIFTDAGQDFMRQHFRETFERGGGEVSIQESEQQKGPLTKLGFTLARHIDQWNAQATTLGVYLRLLEEKGKAFSYDAPIDADAQAKALVLSRRAVASPLAKDVSLSLSRGALTWGNVSLARTLLQFQNIFQDQWSNMRHDFLAAGMGMGTGNPMNPQLAAWMGLAILSMAGWEAGIRLGGAAVTSALTGTYPKKEETIGERMAIDLLRRFPLMSQVMAIARYHTLGVPVIDTAQKIVEEGYRAFTAKTEIARQRAGAKAVTGAAQVLGVPGAGQVGELVEKSL